MKIKWYWPMEMLGLVKNLTGEYNDGYTHYEVSRHCDELMKALLWGLFPALFLLGFLVRRCLARAGQDPFGKGLVYGGTILLLGYAVLLAAGIGPYIQLYPKGGGFLSFDELNHVLMGLYCTMLALSLFLGGRLGQIKG